MSFMVAVLHQATVYLTLHLCLHGAIYVEA